MKIIITPTLNSTEILSKIIRDAFDKIDFEMDYIYGKANELIQTAKDYGLTELSEQMQNDL